MLSTNINILPLKKITNDIERKSIGSMGSIKTLRKLWGQLHCPCNSVHEAKHLIELDTFLYGLFISCGSSRSRIENCQKKGQIPIF